MMHSTTSDGAPELTPSAFTFAEAPELEAWRQTLEQAYPERSYAIMHLTSVSLMVSDVGSYTREELEGQARDDIVSQMLACQSAIVKAVQSLGVTQEHFIETGNRLYKALVLHSQKGGAH